MTLTNALFSPDGCEVFVAEMTDLASVAGDCKCDGLLRDVHYPSSEDVHQLHDFSPTRARRHPDLHQHQLPFCTGDDGML